MPETKRHLELVKIFGNHQLKDHINVLILKNHVKVLIQCADNKNSDIKRYKTELGCLLFYKSVRSNGLSLHKICSFGGCPLIL